MQIMSSCFRNCNCCRLNWLVWVSNGSFMGDSYYWLEFRYWNLMSTANSMKYRRKSKFIRCHRFFHQEFMEGSRPERIKTHPTPQQRNLATFAWIKYFPAANLNRLQSARTIQWIKKETLKAVDNVWG